MCSGQWNIDCGHGDRQTVALWISDHGRQVQRHPASNLSHMLPGTSMAVLKYVMMWTDAMELLKYLQTNYAY